MVRRKLFSIIGDYILAMVLIGVSTALGHVFKPLLQHNSDIIMVYMVGAVVAAAWLGRGPALFYAIISPAFLNYFFIEPLYTLQMYDSSYWLTLLVMFFSSFFVSSLAAKLREQMLLSRRRERETQLFYNLTRQLSVAQDERIMAEDLENCIAEALQSEMNIWFPDEKGELAIFRGDTVGDSEISAARWCFENDEPVGFGTSTKIEASYFYLPIAGTRNLLGVLGVMPRAEKEAYLPDQVIMLKTFSGLFASALERLRSANIAEKTNLLIEKEKMRNILLTSVSHDLRSPLAAIIGAADTLIQQPNQSGLLGSIRKEAGRLSKIINNLLDITRIEGGQLQLNMQPYYPAEIIGAAVDACRGLLKNHRLSLKAEALPLMRMDGTLISQVVQNLLENAANHTPAGTAIDVTADLADKNLRIVVSDNGPGVAAGHEKEIFNKFATFTRGDRPKGTGLGLAICQAIVTAHKGRIWVENKTEGGARFVVELPLSQVQEAAA